MRRVASSVTREAIKCRAVRWLFSFLAVMSSICEFIINRAALVFLSRRAAKRHVFPSLSTLLKPVARFFFVDGKNYRLCKRSSEKIVLSWARTALAFTLSHALYSMSLSPFSKMCAAVSRQYSSSLMKFIGSNLLFLSDLVLSLPSSSLLSSSSLVSPSLLSSPSYDFRGSKLRMSS